MPTAPFGLKTLLTAKKIQQKKIQKKSLPDFFLSFRNAFASPKVSRLLLKDTMVTTEHRKWPKIAPQQHIKPFFCPQELEAGPHSVPYILDIQTILYINCFLVFLNPFILKCQCINFPQAP